MIPTNVFTKSLRLGLSAMAVALSAAGSHVAAQQLDPPCVVEKWSNASTYDKVIDINFSDESMPSTWTSGIGTNTPAFSEGGYHNGILDIPVMANGQPTGVTYPFLFHNCTFANKTTFDGKAGTTAAFARIAYGDKKLVNRNNWKETGHTEYLEDNIKFNTNGEPTYGEAGFVHLCRDAATTDSEGNKVSMHGWIEIDHIPYVDRVQWSWSSSSWGRGMKCDIKIGNGEWKPLVWMGSNKQKQGYTVYSDQGYFMENIINASDVSLRWRIWDGDGSADNKFQTDTVGNNYFASVATDPYGQHQPVKIHKIQIFGNAISAEQAQFARDNRIGDVGEITFGNGSDNNDDAAAQDDYNEMQFFVVDPAGAGNFATIQAAVDAVKDGNRGIIFIKNGTYNEHVSVGTKGAANKYISLIGESREGVIITSSVDRGTSHPTNQYTDCAALSVYTSKFYAENLTIRNTSGPVGQAEALYVAGDSHIFRNCNILGYQDTYKSNAASRGYFENCLIEGTVDFIYDSGLEWFEDCTLRSVGAGYITAPGDASLFLNKTVYSHLSHDIAYCGLFFSNCKLTAANGVAAGSCYLGRPWKEKGGAMYINCKMGSHIAGAGWKEWQSTDVTMAEYGSMDLSGAPISTASRVAWSKQMTATDIEKYFNPSFLFGAMQGKEPFAPESLIASAQAPVAEIIGNSIKWDEVEGAIGYIVLKDGKFVSFGTKRTVSIGNADAEYTILSVTRRGITAAAVARKPLLAFPTAGGFGKLASGGRGGEVVYVTNLDDSGTGSLRWAFEQHAGKPLTIVFSVSGEIALQSPLKVKRNDWTLAGQTAPGDGIVITHDKVNFGGSQNFIVRNIRFRIGQKNSAGNIYAESACGAENCDNFIFDHCTFGWSVEENFDTQDSHFLTVQYCIVHEGLYNAGHSKGPRGYGCQWGGSPATYHHNLLAHNLRRSCRFNGSRGEDYVSYIEYFNNVNYNYEGGGNGCYGGENTAEIASYTGKESAHECNFVNNYYKPGPATTKEPYFVMPSYARDGATSWAPAKWYIAGNIMDGNAAKTADNWKGVSLTDVSGKYTEADLRVNSMIRPALNYYQYTGAGLVGEYDYDKYAYAKEGYETAQESYETVLKCAGTWNRDKVEQRIISDVRNGKAAFGGSAKGAASGIIDTENDAEGFFAYSTSYTVPTDTDGDGMPDEWELANGCDPNTPDNNLISESGYTMLEVYLNSLFRESVGVDTPTDQILAIESNEAWADANGNIHSSVSADYTVTLYNAGGQVVWRGALSGNSIALPSMPAGMYLATICADNLTTRVVKVIFK